jgi:hypothetical protein
MKLTSAAVLLVLLLPAGCGGDDSSFTEGYNKAVEPLSRLGQGLGGKPREFARLAESTRQTRARLAKLDPPDDAKDEFRALLTRLDDVTADLDSVAKAERTDDIVKQRQAAADLVKSSTAVERAETALKQAVEG